MKTWINYSFNKRNGNGMHFHYLRVGKTKKILEDIKSTTSELEIEWIFHETEDFVSQYFGSLYDDFDGAIVNLGVTEDNISEFRKDFWENYIWKIQHSPIVTAFIIPNSELPGSLNRQQVIEYLSLNRLTDRAYEVFEYDENTAFQVTDWLIEMTSIVHRKVRNLEIEEE